MSKTYPQESLLRRLIVRSHRLPVFQWLSDQNHIQRENRLVRWAHRHFGTIVGQNQSLPTPAYTNEDTIWVMWWQGEEQMPDVVRMCYRSIVAHANGNRVVLITQDNVADYVQFPAYITEQVASGVITLTHLSDLVRMELLYRYGGLWIDSTCYVTRPLVIRQGNPLLSTLKSHMRWHGREYRWAVIYLNCARGSKVVKTMRDMFYAYWQMHPRKMKHYYLIEIFLLEIYRHDADMRHAIDDAPYNAEELYYLHPLLNTPADPSVLDQWQATGVFKLTYKVPLMKQVNGEKTLFAKLLEAQQQA